MIRLTSSVAQAFTGQHLFVRIAGTSDGSFVYDFDPFDVEASVGEITYEVDGVTVHLTSDDLSQIENATLDLVRDSLVVRNPNPVPMFGIIPLSGTTTQSQLEELLDRSVNPLLASHGGAVEVVAVRGRVAQLRMTGGCQGCALSAVTMRNAIEQAVVSAVDGIDAVEDVTDHAAGVAPYVALPTRRQHTEEL